MPLSPKKTFVRQLDGSDCGVACLASVLRHYGGHVPLERLRELSGTTQQGTTLLGLYQAAGQLGFTAKGLQAESVAQLQESLSAPVILHVRLGEGPQEHHLSHFLVCYAWDAGRQRFVMGDPAVGLVDYTADELTQRWPSRALLSLTPTERMEQKTLDTRRKRHWLRDTVRPDVPALAVATGLGLAATALSLATAIFSQRLIDHLLPARDVRRLTIGLVLLGAVLLARAGLGFLRGWLLTRQSQDLSNRLTGGFFGTLLYLPKPFFDGRQTGDFIARLNDTGRIQQAISHLAGAVIINLLVVVAALTYIGLYSGLLAGCMAAYASLYGLLAWHYNQPIQAAQRAAMAAAAVNESQYIDTLQGIADVKATGQEALFAGLTQALFGRLQAAVYGLRQVGLRFGTAAEVLGAVFTTGILALAAYLVVQKALTVGELVGILSMVGTVVPAVGSLALTNLQLQEARVAFERMYEYSKNEPEIAKDAEAAPFDLQRLDVADLSFSFPGRAPLYEGLSLSVGRGELVVLMGESGTGKTTLLQVLQRFYPSNQGRVQANGADWQALTTPTWRRVVGVVAQHPKLFNGTLLDNIMLGKPTAGPAAVVEFCREWGFAPYFEQLPQGYYTPLGEQGVALSGGQRQLVGLARALFAGPQLLLLDEPTAALDPRTEQFVFALLARLRPQLAVLLITHKRSLTALADRVYTLQAGRLVEAPAGQAAVAA